jgi:hypothetical protein
LKHLNKIKQVIKKLHIKDTEGDHFLFGSVFIKKIVIKLIFFKKKPKPVQTDWFRFGFLGQKPVQTGSALFFWFGSVFFRFGSLFVRFGSVFSVIFFQFS